jgi:hypothetical protein
LGFVALPASSSEYGYGGAAHVIQLRERKREGGRGEKEKGRMVEKEKKKKKKKKNQSSRPRRTTRYQVFFFSFSPRLYQISVPETASRRAPLHKEGTPFTIISAQVGESWPYRVHP